MRVWTNGTAGRIWVADTIYRFRDGALSVEGTLKKIKGAQDTNADEAVAWSPKAVRIDPGLEKKRRRVLDVVALSAERVAAAISEGRSGPRLVIGPPEGPFEVDVPLAGDGVRAAWPDGAIWDTADAAPWPDAERLTGAQLRGVRVHANEHGVGVAGGSSGHVAVLKPDTEELAFVLRVPGHDDARLDAVPTERGVLVTLVLDRERSAVCHFADDGALLGRWPKASASGGFAALRLDDERVLAFDTETGLSLLSLPDLTELATESLSDPIVDAHAAKSGNLVLLADGASVYELSVEDESLSLDGPYLLAEAKKARQDELDEAAPGYEPARMTGPAQIAFPAKGTAPKDPPWTYRVGRTGKIKMKLRSGGGPGQGVVVELSGAGLAQIEPLKLSVGGVSAAFDVSNGVARAEVNGHPLPQGIFLPLDPKPTKDDEKEQAKELIAATQFVLEIELRAAKAGGGLFTVAVQPCESSSAPLKRTRPLTVEAEDAG